MLTGWYSWNMFMVFLAFGINGMNRKISVHPLDLNCWQKLPVCFFCGKEGNMMRRMMMMMMTTMVMMMMMVAVMMMMMMMMVVVVVVMVVLMMMMKMMMIIIMTVWGERWITPSFWYWDHGLGGATCHMFSCVCVLWHICIYVQPTI